MIKFLSLLFLLPACSFCQENPEFPEVRNKNKSVYESSKFQNKQNLDIRTLRYGRYSTNAVPTYLGGIKFSNTTGNALTFPDGTTQNTATGGGSGFYWASNGTRLYNTNTGNVGVNIATPTAQLQVNASNSLQTILSSNTSNGLGGISITGNGENTWSWYEYANNSSCIGISNITETFCMTPKNEVDIKGPLTVTSSATINAALLIGSPNSISVSSQIISPAGSGWLDFSQNNIINFNLNSALGQLREVHVYANWAANQSQAPPFTVHQASTGEDWIRLDAPSEGESSTVPSDTWLIGSDQTYGTRKAPRPFVIQRDQTNIMPFLIDQWSVGVGIAVSTGTPLNEFVVKSTTTNNGNLPYKSEQQANTNGWDFGTLDSDSYFHFRVYSSGSEGTDQVTIKSGPKFGVGVSNPAYKMDTGSYEQISNACTNVTSCVATCSTGKQVMGGGCSGVTTTFADSYPSSTTAWTCTITLGNVTSYAICVNLN